MEVALRQIQYFPGLLQDHYFKKNTSRIGLIGSAS